MKVLFLGVGEACDSLHGNTSVLITTNNSTMLLDCGFSVPHRFFGYCDDPDCLDGIWISHFHGDHFFGLPLLLLRLWDMGRRKSLQFIGQPQLEEKTIEALELAYPGFSKKLAFPLEFRTISPGSPLMMNDLQLQAGQSDHSPCNYGLLIDSGSHKLYYSGDGRPTAETRNLIHNCDLALHEAFTFNDSMPGHGSITRCLQLMKEENIKQLALLHIERTTRKMQKEAIEDLVKQRPGLLLPQEGDNIILK